MSINTRSLQDVSHVLRWTTTEEVLREERRIDNGNSRRIHAFNVVTDDAGTPRAVVRELPGSGRRYHLPDKLRALRVLEESGVSLASRLPIRVAPDRELMIVEYIDGKDLDKHPGAAHPDKLLSHAISLGRYYCRAVLEEDYVLSDIAHPQQYRVRDGVPVLVDIDPYLEDATIIDPDEASNALDEIGRLYRPWLPSNLATELSDTVQSMKSDILY